MASGSPLQEIQAAGAPVAGIPAAGAPGVTASSAAPRESAPASVGLVVLSRDEALVRTLQTIGAQYDVFAVSAESDFASHLLSQSMGVAILDASAVASPIERLTERLRAQFPDLVLIVAGSVDDQSALATQITNGTVYRFLHKPVSEQRVRLFVDAAWRRHGEEHAGSDASAAAARSSRERPGIGANMLVLGGAAMSAIALLGGWLLLHRADRQPPQLSAPAIADTPPATEPRDAVLEDQLARAEKALASGALVSPPGANAADLYGQALRRNPKDSRAANGVEKVIDRLLSAAEAQLLAQHLDEAQKLTDEARAIKPDHVRVAFLMAQIGKERERATLAQARQAASSGNIEQALSVLDGATREGQHSTLVTAARQELEQKKLDERVRDYVNRANDRMRTGQLVEPAQDNAQFYVESARALAPNDSEVKQTQRQFLDRLVSEARKALVTGNADEGEHWIQVAADAGVNADDIETLTQEAQRVRTAAKADALARLALLFNQRLTQGKVLDPASDSAKFYLTELVQSDPTHPSTQAAHQAFAARTLDEAKSAARRQDYPGAQRWLAEAHDAGVDAGSISAVNNEINSDIRTAQDAARKANEFVTGAALELTHYVPPMFPSAARERSMSGWVDVQFMVMTDGSVSDISVVGADPAGAFEQSATDAVRKWKYRPILRGGQPTNQRARVRVRFALEK
jgi:TonB family protein